MSFSFSKIKNYTCPLDDGYHDEYYNTDFDPHDYQYSPIAIFHGYGEDCRYTKHRGCNTYYYLN